MRSITRIGCAAVLAGGLLGGCKKNTPAPAGGAASAPAGGAGGGGTAAGGGGPAAPAAPTSPADIKAAVDKGRTVNMPICKTADAQGAFKPGDMKPTDQLVASLYSSVTINDTTKNQYSDYVGQKAGVVSWDPYTAEIVIVTDDSDPCQAEIKNDMATGVTAKGNPAIVLSLQNQKDGPATYTETLQNMGGTPGDLTAGSGATVTNPDQNNNEKTTYMAGMGQGYFTVTKVDSGKSLDGMIETCLDPTMSFFGDPIDPKAFVIGPVHATWCPKVPPTTQPASQP
jgi:hypothetical protein